MLPFWKRIKAANALMKVVRVTIHGRRIVGVNIFPGSLGAVKALIAEGLAVSARAEARLKDLPQCPFLCAPGPALVAHDCLSSDGTEALSLTVDEGLDPGAVVFARFFEIPVASTAQTPAGERAAAHRLKQAAWKSCPDIRVFVNGQRVAVPPSLLKAPGPLVLERTLLRGGANELRVVTRGERLFLVVQAGRRMPIDEVRPPRSARRPARRVVEGTLGPEGVPSFQITCAAGRGACG